MAIPSMRGGGALGHAALCMLAGDYNNLPAGAGINWADPAHPGPAPVVPLAATAAQITEINRQYKANDDEYKLFKATEAALRKCLITAIPATYIDILEDELFGFSNVQPRDLVAHMTIQYAQVTQDDLTENIKTLNESWDPQEPIEKLWTQLRRCQLFAANFDPISDNTLVRSAIANLEASGVFMDALKDWRKRTVLTQTLANLKTDFNSADKERRRLTTSREAGYANAAVVSDDESTTSNKENTGNGLYYCWSHGLGINKNHTSTTCSNKQPGHQTKATVFNMMGGCNRIHRRYQEKTVYKAPQRESNPTQNPAPSSDDK